MPLLLILEASMVCVTLDVTDATTTTAPVMATSILWAFITSSVARLRRVEEASPGDPGRFLLSSMVPIVTGKIPGPILHYGRGHTLDTMGVSMELRGGLHGGPWNSMEVSMEV